MSEAKGISIETTAPLLGSRLLQIAPNPRSYFDLITFAGLVEPMNLGMLCGGEERGGPLMGFLCKHPDSDRLCLADVFFSSYYPVEGGDVTNSFYNFRELSARPDVSFTGSEGGYYLAVAIDMHREQQLLDNGPAVQQWARNNKIMSDAGISPKYELGKVPFKPLLVLPGASVLYEGANLDGKMCGGMPTITFDFHVDQVVTVKDLTGKPEWNGNSAVIKKLASDPNDPEARYEVLFTDDSVKGANGFLARARNLCVKTESSEEDARDYVYEVSTAGAVLRIPADYAAKKEPMAV